MRATVTRVSILAAGRFELSLITLVTLVAWIGVFAEMDDNPSLKVKGEKIYAPLGAHNGRTPEFWGNTERIFHEGSRTSWVRTQLW